MHLIRRIGIPAALGISMMSFTPFGCSKPLSRASVGVAEPARDLPGVANLSRDGAVYFAGQPSAETLKAAADEGVRVVINLRTADEMQTSVDFDEAATARSLGLTYVTIPVTPATFSAADADQLHDVFEDTSGPVLLHCGSANRVGALWALYLTRHRGMSIDEALERGRKAGMRSADLAERVRREASE